MFDVPVVRLFHAKTSFTLDALDQRVWHEIVSTTHVITVQLHAFELDVTFLTSRRLPLEWKVVSEWSDLTKQEFRMLLLIMFPKSFPVRPSDIVLTKRARESDVAVGQEMEITYVLLVENKCAERTTEVHVTSVLIRTSFQMALNLLPREQQQPAVNTLVTVAIVKINMAAQLILFVEDKTTIFTRIHSSVHVDFVHSAKVAQKIIPVVIRCLELTFWTLVMIYILILRVD